MVGSPVRNSEIEPDVVSESLDGTTLLVGECKWSDNMTRVLIITEILPVSELAHRTNENDILLVADGYQRSQPDAELYLGRGCREVL